MADELVSFRREVRLLDDVLRSLEDTLSEIGKRLHRFEENNEDVENAEYEHSFEEYERLETIIFHINEAAGLLEEIQPVTLG